MPSSDKVVVVVVVVVAAAELIIIIILNSLGGLGKDGKGVKKNSVLHSCYQIKFKTAEW
jgi:hypothetical protein